MLKYANEVEIPSWTSSDGTLRLLALTIPAYLADIQGIYLTLSFPDTNPSAFIPFPMRLEFIHNATAGFERPERNY